MTQLLSGKTILITGAAGGLGSRLSLLCARASGNVVMIDSERHRLEQTYDDIVERGFDKPALHPMDLATIGPEHVDELITAIEAEFGGLDALVHCAAAFDGLQPLEQISPADWLRALQINLNACWLLSIRCLPLLRLAGNPCLYFLLEDPERVQGSYWGAYGVSKHALRALVSQFAAECGPSGIQVLGINPGPMRTRLRASAYHAEHPESQPSPEVAAAAIFDLLTGASSPEGVFVELTQT